jgi:hypothetical protein
MIVDLTSFVMPELASPFGLPAVGDSLFFNA